MIVCSESEQTEGLTFVIVAEKKPALLVLTGITLQYHYITKGYNGQKNVDSTSKESYLTLAIYF